MEKTKLITGFLVLVCTYITLCLSAPRSTRIFNGQAVIKGQFPWQVEIYSERYFGLVHCGGAIISEEWILTAAHCIIAADLPDQENLNRNFTVILGTVNLEDPDRVVINTTEYRVYDLFNPWGPGEGDLAAIKLPLPVNFTDYIKPISLGSVGSGVPVYASGWGYTSSNDTEISNQLTYANFTTLSDEECAQKVSVGVGEGLMCAVPSGTIKQNICGGESGSALVTDPFTNPLHVGLVATYRSCENDEFAGFSRTVFFKDWIKNVTGVEVALSTTKTNTKTC